MESSLHTTTATLDLIGPNASGCHCVSSLWRLRCQETATPRDYRADEACRFEPARSDRHRRCGCMGASASASCASSASSAYGARIPRRRRRARPAPAPAPAPSRTPATSSSRTAPRSTSRSASRSRATPSPPPSRSPTRSCSATRGARRAGRDPPAQDPPFRQALIVGPCGSLSVTVRNAQGVAVYPGPVYYNCPFLTSFRLASHATATATGTWNQTELLPTAVTPSTRPRAPTAWWWTGPSPSRSPSPRPEPGPASIQSFVPPAPAPAPERRSKKRNEGEHVGSLEVGDHQVPQGRPGQGPRQDLRQVHTTRRGRGTGRGRGPRGQRHPPHRLPEGESGQRPARHDREGDQARHGRPRGRALRGHQLRGLRARRRGHHGRDAQRQPQPHRRRDAQPLQPQRRQHGRAGRRRLAVRAQGHRDRRASTTTRTR